MKVLQGLCLCLMLLTACCKARPEELRPEHKANQCPAVDPLLYTVHLPHPSDCNMFLRCDHGTAKPERCPAQLHFNPVLQVCDWPAKARCAGVDDVVEWNANGKPQVEDPQQDMPTHELVPDKATENEYIPNDWVEGADVQNEAIEDEGVDGGPTLSGVGDDEDIFDAVLEY